MLGLIWWEHWGWGLEDALYAETYAISQCEARAFDIRVVHKGPRMITP